MIKYILVLSFFIFGCSHKSYIYIDIPKVTQTMAKKEFGVKEISLPYYLEKSKIAYIENGKIKYFDSYFSSDAKSFATKRAINIFQTIYNNPVISLYPWESKSHNYIAIDIQKFISDKNKLYLVAKYSLYHDKKLINSHNYNKEITLKTFDEKTVTKQMQEMFDNFIKYIARNIDAV